MNTTEARAAQPEQPEQSAKGAQRGNFVLRGSEELRTTLYSDVCGGTDELKRLVMEEEAQTHTAEGRKAVRQLVDDGIYMLARMEVRLRAYQGVRDELARLAQQMHEIEEPRLAAAQTEAERLRTLLDGGGELRQEELVDRAEEIRQVANDMEGALRRHKEAVLAAGKVVEALLGKRRAGVDANAGDGASGAAGGDAADEVPAWIPEAWLPPEPHREKVVDWLKRGRMALLSEEEASKLPVGPQGREPMVQFEDGGVMPLRVVRWNEEVRNFHPLGSDPHPRSRLYRGRHANPLAETPSASGG
ncbi:MAG TPA: hypothetical protein VNM48_10005 [Chloroflexota bacterium]|nr:hypothetical protein [Chloroflexota bacterium]